MNPDCYVNRRELLKTTAGAGLLADMSFLQAADTKPLPTRMLGRTKRQVTILGLGTAPIGEGPVDVQEAAAIFSEVIDAGVNYVDTAYIYGNAEEALGHVLPSRRDKLFLVTKVWADNAKKAEEMLNTSLDRMKVDHVDLCHIHHIGGKDVEKVLADDGVLNYLIQQRKSGRIKHIGLSGHARSSRFMPVLETGEIDVVMPVLNFADRNIYDFEYSVLPYCREHRIGVVAMKVYAGIKGGFKFHKKGFVGCAMDPRHLSEAMAYALDLPGVSAAIIGPYTMEQAQQNVQLAHAYKPLSDSERAFMLKYGKDLAAELGPRYGPAII